MLINQLLFQILLFQGMLRVRGQLGDGSRDTILNNILARFHLFNVCEQSARLLVNQDKARLDDILRSSSCLTTLNLVLLRFHYQWRLTIRGDNSSPIQTNHVIFKTETFPSGHIAAITSRGDLA